MNMKETAWHQDSAYLRRVTFSRRRVHWWLPLHDVTIEQGCMQFVPGSHNSRRMSHVPVAPTSDALKTVLPEGRKRDGPSAGHPKLHGPELDPLAARSVHHSVCETHSVPYAIAVIAQAATTLNS